MKTFQELKKITKHLPADLPAIKVALTGDTATQFLATAIRGSGAERGYQIDLFEAEYNQAWPKIQIAMIVLFLIGSIFQHYAEGMLIVALCLLLRVIRFEK